jgi:hypothetical protein
VQAHQRTDRLKSRIAGIACNHVLAKGLNGVDDCGQVGGHQPAFLVDGLIRIKGVPEVPEPVERGGKVGHSGNVAAADWLASVISGRRLGRRYATSGFKL